MTSYTVGVFFNGANQQITFTATGKAHNAISDEMADIIGNYLATRDENLVHRTSKARGAPIEADGYFHYRAGNELVAFRRADFGALTIDLLKTGSVNSNKHIFK